MIDVALVTCRELPEPDFDAAPLAEALADAGIVAHTRAWDEPAIDWSEARLTVLRSAWNYPVRREEFVLWASTVARLSRLENPLGVVTWNSHKRYLFDLERRGVPIVPTALVARGATPSLRSLVERRGWQDVVIKPAVSAASLGTRRFGPAAFEAGEEHLHRLAASGDVLVQAYLPAVESYGERALVWIDGELTHAVRKHPRFEGDAESVSDAVLIAPAEAALAGTALAAVAAPLLYGRVDVAPGLDGEPVVMELELVEPSLFFPRCPAALRRFVNGIRTRLGREPMIG